MSIITDIRLIDREAWTQLVAVSPTATWFQTPEAYDFYASVPELLTPFVVAVTRETRASLVGVCVGYVSKASNPVAQYFTRRAIIFGGPLLAEDIKDDELSPLLLTVSELVCKQAIYVETRNFQSFANWEHVFASCGFMYQPHYDMHIDCSNREQMISLIHESKQRHIRKMESEGVQIVEASSPQEVHDYYVLLRHLYRHKVHRPVFAEEFFQRFVADKRGVLLLAKQNNVVLGGVLCPILPSTAIYEWYLVGPGIVMWAAMDYANKHSIPIFDLMGGGKPDQEYGVRKFKQQFGGYICKFGRYLKINNTILYALGKFGIEKLKIG